MDLTPELLKDYFFDLAKAEALLTNASLQALLLFGSRANGNARPNSDLDVFAIVDGVNDEGNEFALHHRGTLFLASSNIEIEMPIGTFQSLKKALDNKNPVLTPIINDSKVVFENPLGLTRELKDKAKSTVAIEIDSIVKKLQKGDFEREVALCRVEYRDLLNITRSTLNRKSLSLLARLTEAFSSFYQDLLSLQGMQTEDEKTLRECAKNLYVARGIRAQRFLDVSRYESPKWFTEFVRAAERILSDVVTAEAIDKIFALISKTSKEQIGLSMVAAPSEKISATVRRG